MNVLVIEEGTEEQLKANMLSLMEVERCCFCYAFYPVRTASLPYWCGRCEMGNFLVNYYPVLREGGINYDYTK